MTKKPELLSDLQSAVNEIIKRCGGELILAAPLGLGKPNELLNQLYQQVKSQPELLRLTIYTALSLQVIQAKQGLESRFLKPFVSRHFGDDYPQLEYLVDRNLDNLPHNVQIHEFYFSSGSELGNTSAQQHYISQNYTHVARDLVAAEVNVVIQQVAKRGERISFSCNPDVTLDLIEKARQQQRPLLVVGVINSELAFLGGDANVSRDVFDILVDENIASPLFAIPREAVSNVDHAIGLHASTLVKDGGTLQIGIGALSDAIVNALILRHHDNSKYLAGLNAIQSNHTSQLVEDWGGLLPFEKGLYGATEMVMDGFMHLRKAGILTRQVFDDLILQQLLDQQLISNPLASGDLQQLLKHSLVAKKLTLKNLAWLKRFGLVESHCVVDGENLRFDNEPSIGRDLISTENLSALDKHMSGRLLVGGRYLEGAFFLGSKELYSWFKQLNAPDWNGLWMRRVSHINELLGGQETLDRLQRRDARFFNTCMMHTLLGSAISDGLDDGQVVSGVGGQYNFVAMAHALDDGRSIILLRSTRTTRGKTVSNIRWNYPHSTIPRHLRDIVITEYGIADLRGQCDSEVIKRLLAITDARFQPELLASAKRAGKIDTSFIIPASWIKNLPSRLDVVSTNENFKLYPFGSDFDETELHLITALQALKFATDSSLGKIMSIGKNLLPRSLPDHTEPYLSRMGLANPEKLKDKILARMLARYL